MVAPLRARACAHALARAPARSRARAPDRVQLRPTASNHPTAAGNDWPWWVDPGHSWPWPTMASQFPSKACQLQTATRLFSFCKRLRKHVWPGHHPVPAVLGTGFCKLLRKHVWPGHHPVPAVLGTGTGLVTSPPHHRSLLAWVPGNPAHAGHQFQFTKKRLDDFRPQDLLRA